MKTGGSSNWSWRSALFPILLTAVAFLADQRGVFRELHNFATTMRMALSERAASGEIVFVAIDAQSVTEIGIWPWPREVHADLLDRLTEAGARDVFLDIDLSLPSSRESDAALAAALQRSGTAWLATFIQAAAAGSDRTSVNRPLPAFAEHGWPASVNVVTDEYGIIRHYPYGYVVDDMFLPSAAALLAGAYVEATTPFPVNFAIQPNSVPVVSVSQILSGEFAAETLRNRSVVVGASAVELGDLFSLPVHGVQPGPLVHILAAETLLQDVVPRTLRTEVVFACALLLMLVIERRGLHTPLRMLLALTLLGSASEAAALTVFAQSAVILPTAPAYPVLAVFILCKLARRLALSAFIIRDQANDIRATAALLGTVFDDSSDAIVVLDSKGTILRHSRSAEALFGQARDGAFPLPEVLRQHARTCFVENYRSRTMDVPEVPCLGGPRHLEVTTSLSKFAVEKDDTKALRFILTLSIRDVTQLKEQQARITYLSDYDEITGALRRHAFLTALESRLRSGEPYAVFVLRLRNVEMINALLGRDVGDQLLRNVVQRLRASEIADPAIARLAGSSFALFASSATDITTTADRLADLIETQIAEHVGNFAVRIAVGYSRLLTRQMASAREALYQAEEACRLAHARQRRKPMLYDPALARLQLRARQIEREMPDAVENREFSIAYQPQHMVEAGTLVGSEALVRWHSPVLGDVTPDEFIPIAESTGFIETLGLWVLDQALLDLKRMPDHLNVAVNVSGIQMQNSDLLGDITRLLRTHEIPASRLCLELTETVMMSSADALIERMADIRFSGIQWALDDFGTGYSSMTYLSQMPLDKIKLDKSFILGLGIDPAALPILKAVSDLCRNLDVKLLCEGVETEDHLAVLQRHGCAEAQGFYFGRPLELESFLEHCRRCAPDIQTR